MGEERGREFVGDVECVVANEGKLRGEFLGDGQLGEVADENRVRLAVEDESREPFLPRLDDAHRGQRDGDSGLIRERDGLFVLTDVFVVGVDAAEEVGVGIAPSEDGLKLRKITHENVQLGRSRGSGSGLYCD